jgi:hypothetical protein
MNRLNLDVCAIILNYDDYNNTVRLASELVGFDSIDKIVIVDNNSTDNSYYLLKKDFADCEKIEVVSSGKNGGYAFGNNFGIKYALNKYDVKGFFILNPDVRVEESTLQKIIKFVKDNSELKIGTVGAKNDSGVSAWKLPSFKDCLLLSSFVLSKLTGGDISVIPKLLYKNEEFNERKEFARAEVLPGSFFFIISEAIQDVGFLDEGTFLYFEESILAYKLLQRGYSNYLLTDVSFSHLEQGSTRRIKFLKRYIMLQRSRMYYLVKYLNCNKFLIVLFKVITFCGILEFLLYNFFKNMVRMTWKLLTRKRRIT